MSAYPEGRFVESFAERTKANLEFIEERVKEEKIEGKSSEEISLYETTQLINSLIGLLIFPNADYYKTLSCDIAFKNNEANEIIDKYLENSGDYTYKNTYRKKITSCKNHKTLTHYEEEGFSLYILIRHLRNAVAHRRIGIIPESPEKGKDIEYITFEDVGPTVFFKKKDGEYIYCDEKHTHGNDELKIRQVFEITISTKDLKILLYEISDLLCYSAKEKRKRGK